MKTLRFTARPFRIQSRLTMQLLNCLFAIGCAWFPSFASSAEPEVSNVRAAQRAGTKLVDVYYDLSGADGSETVLVSVSSDGGISYSVSAMSFSGGVGDGVANGANKHVVWNAGADWNGQLSQAVKFRIAAGRVPDGFALIPAGNFMIGDTSGAWDLQNARPPASIYVSAFYMANYEVTKALWDEVRLWGSLNGYTDLPSGEGKAPDHPVQTLSWIDVVKWCNARSQREGLTPCYTVSGSIYKTGNSNEQVCNWSANGYRLPTEAEWEKAARGGLSGKHFPWGDTISHNQANYYVYYRYNGLTGEIENTYEYDLSPTRGHHPSYQGGGTPYTSPVGSFAVSGYSLRDMVGNVSEWCWDWYGPSYTNGASDPRGRSSGNHRVARGSGWAVIAFGGINVNSRIAHRLHFPPFSTFDFVGFRTARSSVP